MSLFGGDDRTSQDQSPSGSESDLDFSNASPPAEHAPIAPLSDRKDKKIAQTSEVFATGPGSETESEELDDTNPPARPNRFTGPPPTWKSHTAAERHVAISLNQLEETDLSAQLYNTHALKQRVRKSAKHIAGLHNWQSKDTWLRKGKELEYTDNVGELQVELIPSKDWTAWPLPPARLSIQKDRTRQTIVGRYDNQWAVDGLNIQNPGQELRQELLGLFQRIAKENWRSKTPQSQLQQNHSDLSGPRVEFQPKNPQYMKSRAGVEKKTHHDSDTDHQVENRLAGSNRGRKPQLRAHTKPVVLADDARALDIIQPTVHSILRQLDDVALAIRRTRLNHFRHGVLDEVSSQSEFTSDFESTASRPRSSRQKISLSKSRRTRTVTRPSNPELEKHKSFAQDDSDSGSEYEEPRAASPQHRQKRSLSSSERVQVEDASNMRDWSGRSGLMDWSEILGLAAINRWNEQAVSRTADRCAAIFGEGMSFTTLDENPVKNPNTGAIYHTPKATIKTETRAIGVPKTPKRPLFQVGTLRCPHKDCYGNEKEFGLPYRVVEHCMRAHGYDPRSNDSENEERTVGGVHVDGFLQPITAKQGWLGHGRSKIGGRKRKARRTEKGDVYASEASLCAGQEQED